MDLVKWHGLGNDYLVLDARSGRPRDADALARRLSDRRRGPGADGLLLVVPPIGTEADFGMTILNADGSDGGVCGNGLRCVAAWAIREGLLEPTSGDSGCPTFRIETPGGLVEARVEDGAGTPRATVRLRLPAPRFELSTLPAAIPGRSPEAVVAGESLPRLAEVAGLSESVSWSLVSTGNPHLVAHLADPEDVDRVDLHAIGPRLERHEWFPRRVNVHVAGRRGPASIRMRTWERGSGVTEACGTGACAVVAASVRLGVARGGEPIDVELPGGRLEIAWAGGPEDALFMRGEAAEVCRIEIAEAFKFTGENPVTES